MNTSYYTLNPIARQFLGEYQESLLENEQVDQLLSKIADNTLNCFKFLNFDLAPKRERNPDVIRVKLSAISDSNSVKSLTAKLKDYSSDSDIINSKFAETKRLYLEALDKLCDSLNRTSEISKEKNDVILKQFRISCTKLQNSIDTIAKQAQEEEKRRELSENEGFDQLNESLFGGYKNRIQSLKRNLTNLISSAEGKDQRSGYGKDWKRIFLDLDERRKAIDVSESGDRNRKALEDLEKSVEKMQEEFYNSMVQTANRSLQKLEDDEEIYSTYSDVTTLVNQALDLMTRAKSQYFMALKEIKDEREAKDTEMTKSVFPLKRGDTDSDKKIKGSKLIYSIQTALCNGIPAANKLIKSKGGPNGKYGPATTAVVSTIQKISGNKNANGQIDNSLMKDILSSDWVSSEDKKAINSALHTIGSKMTNENLNRGYVNNISEFFGQVFEDKIVINNSEFEKELDSQYKTIKSAISSDEKEDVHVENKGKSDVKSLSKKLRQEYSLKIESDDFLKSDGSLKSSYTPEFIAAWNTALAKIEKYSEYGYFFFNGGVYNINLASSSLKTSCNWKKWAESRSISSMDNEDCVEFINNYLNGYTTFGMVRPQFRYDGIKEIMKKNLSNEELDLSGPFEMMEACIKHGVTPFIDFEDLKGDIKKAFDIILQKNEKDPDLGKEEFIALNNFLIMVSNCVSFDGKNFISCIKWINENVLGEKTAKRISKDLVFNIKDTGDEDSGPILTYEGSKIVLGKWDLMYKKIKTDRPVSEALPGLKVISELKDSTNSMKIILGKTAYYISTDIYPSIETHLKRLNSSEFDQVPQGSPFKCVDTKM